jgi:hypothetical protein
MDLTRRVDAPIDFSAPMITQSPVLVFKNLWQQPYYRVSDKVSASKKENMGGRRCAACLRSKVLSLGDQ